MLFIAMTLALSVCSSQALAQSSGERRLLGDEESEKKCPRNLPPETASDAKRMTLLGVSCFKEEQFAQAYTYYHRAYEIEKSDLLRAAMGRSLHEIGIYEVAAFYYEAYLDSNDSGKGADKIRRRMEQLEKDTDEKGVETQLKSFPPNSTVHVELTNGDWVKLGDSPTVVHLREGRYRFAYERPNYRRRHVRRRLTKAGNPVVVDAQLYHEKSLFKVTAHRWKRNAFVMSLASIPLIGGGVVFFGLTKDKFAEAEDYISDPNYTPGRQNELVEQGHKYQRWAIGLSTLGGVTLLTAGALFLHGKALEPKTAKSASAGMQPVVGPDFVGVRGSF